MLLCVCEEQNRLDAALGNGYRARGSRQSRHCFINAYLFVCGACLATLVLIMGTFLIYRMHRIFKAKLLKCKIYILYIIISYFIKLNKKKINK